MKLIKKQEHAVHYLKDRTTTELLYGGSAGGGKSVLGCLWLIEMCQTHAGSRWLMGRSKLKALKETTLNSFFDIASDLNISDQFTYNAQSNIIYWTNGSEIILKDLFLYPSDPLFDKLGSLEISGAFIDECNQVAFKAWQIVKSRIRYKLKEFDLIPKVLGTCNPSKNWTYKRFYKPSKEGDLIHYRKFISALPTDNEHLPQSYLDSLLELDKQSRERLYYGNWEYDNDPSTIIDYDSITGYFNPLHLEEGEKKYITIDVARQGKDKSVIRVWDGWLCIKRVSFAKNTITGLADSVQGLMKQYKISRINVIADEDGVGGGLVDILRCKGFVNGSRALNEENYSNLKSQCSHKMGMKIVKGEVGEVCDDNSLIDVISEEMETVKLVDMDKDGKIKVLPKDRVKDLIGRSPDEWDTIMMRYWFELIPKRTSSLKV
jgi:hypothetical protein